MMDNLEKVLSVLFKRVPVQEIIDGKFLSGNIACADFVQLMRSYSNKYSDTELKNLYHYLTSGFTDHFYTAERPRYESDALDVFYLLRCYSEWILTVEDNELVCEYSRFLHWRMITNELCEDLFTASFYAARHPRKVMDQINPVRFDWKVVTTHNNRELRKILAQGMAENHSHLKGSSPIFQLTWISMMNNLELSANSEKIREIDHNRRNVNIKYNSSYKEEPFSIQLLQAACIRFLMFELIYSSIEEQKKLDKYTDSILGKIKCCYTYLRMPEYIFDIKGDLMSHIYSRQNMNFGETFADYALAGLLDEGGDRNDRNLIFQGERWLLYRFFNGIFHNTKLNAFRDLFYSYLVIKENFRAEFVQNNKSVGFENFSIYEQRKDMFLESPFFKKELVKKAIETSFLESNVVAAETRIAPKKSADDYYRYIEDTDQRISMKKKYRCRFFYTIHFIKSEDHGAEDGYMMYRHWKERKLYREQAVGLAEFRERYPNHANRIRGIDAANTEIGCGPEVFAQVFRYLSDHRVITLSGKELAVPQLRITYHVGEDFLDLTSGLRAIDEALHFLGIKCGDRLGHAIALGIDVEEWYQSKNYRVVLPQQEYLDNIAWMYRLSVLFDLDGIENFLNFLRKEYEYYFQLLYGNAMDQKMLGHLSDKARRHYKNTEWEKYYSHRMYEFTIENYCSAWELRGDNPELYQDGFYDNQSIIDNQWKSFSYYSLNRTFPEQQNKRYFQEVSLIYYYYHFDEDVRKEGEKPIEKKVGSEYIQCIRKLQYELQKVVARRGVGIETNPSSNFLISTFKRYDKHPILNFYNKDLVEDWEKLQACPQINVSINTDDAGIFGTSLENEYAYMALALEKAKDEQGNILYKKANIYEWLEHIRRMGLRQTFLSDEELKQATKKWNKNKLFK